MNLRSIRDVDVAGKRVLVRVDFNVPMDGERITDETRIRASLPTIEYLVHRDARVILMSHLGRPKGKPNPAYSLEPLVERVASLVGRPVAFAHDTVGADAEARIAEMGNGDLVLLENVRFEPGEETDDLDLSRKIAGLADMYVNDAFGTAHRAHASTHGVASFLPSYAGFLMEAEISALARLTELPTQPFVAIIGGAKVSDKLGVLEHLVDRVDALVIGGGMANTFLLARGHAIGRSLAEPDFTDAARRLTDKAASLGKALLLPGDVVVARSIDEAGRCISIDAVSDDDSIFDIGDATIEQLEKVIGSARTIFWNGPMGVFERPQFATGTRRVAEMVAGSAAFTVVGGGDSVAAIEQMGLTRRISHISTGGGAALEFVEGRDLPGLAVLSDEAPG